MKHLQIKELSNTEIALIQLITYKGKVKQNSGFEDFRDLKICNMAIEKGMPLDEFEQSLIDEGSSDPKTFYDNEPRHQLLAIKAIDYLNGTHKM